jgi:hypothetical protein
MVNWEDELKRYIARKFKETMGEDIPLDHIYTLELNVDLDLPSLSIHDLASIYSFAIMKEDFEEAKKIADELQKRDCEIRIETDDKNKTGVINFYIKPQVSIPYLDIKMKILPDGMMVDFNKEDF